MLCIKRSPSPGREPGQGITIYGGAETICLRTGGRAAYFKRAYAFFSRVLDVIFSPTFCSAANLLGS